VRVPSLGIELVGMSLGLELGVGAVIGIYFGELLGTESWGRHWSSMLLLNLALHIVRYSRAS
jgi:hypothetical protein